MMELTFKLLSREEGKGRNCEDWKGISQKGAKKCIMLKK